MKGDQRKDCQKSTKSLPVVNWSTIKAHNNTDDDNNDHDHDHANTITYDSDNDNDNNILDAYI